MRTEILSFHYCDPKFMYQVAPTVYRMSKLGMKLQFVTILVQPDSLAKDICVIGSGTSAGTPAYLLQLEIPPKATLTCN